LKTILNERDRSEVMERISKMRDDSPREWGRMTPNQAICHLTDAFSACLGERPAADRSNVFTRSLLRLLAISSPMPWPKGVKTMPEVDQEIDGTPPTGLAPDLARLRSVVDRFLEEMDPASMRHPIFGAMSAAEWGRWGYRHVDHHARQFGL